MKKILFPSILLIVLIASSLVMLAEKKNKQTETKIRPIAEIVVKSRQSKEKQKQKDTITVIAVGDVMFGTNYPQSPNYLPPHNDCHSLLGPLADTLKQADLTFGNCEGTFSDHPEYARHCDHPQWCYRFSMPTKYVKCFVDAGFDVVSNANNHVHDLGAYGVKSTMKTLKNAGLHFAGLCKQPVDTFTINGVKWGFCAFAPNQGTCQINDYKKMQKRIRKLKSECDLVLVSFHGGAEGSKHQHIPRKHEIFLGQDRGNVYEFAHLAVDAGADLVIGQGPHVTRAVEVYKNKFIAYSLGNFCTYRRFNLQGPNGIAPILKLWINKNGNFIKAKIIPVYQDKMTGTKYDPKGRIIKKMQELTAEDFPDGILNISDNGWITLKKKK